MSVSKKVQNNFKSYLVLFLFVGIGGYSNAQQDPCYSDHANMTSEVGDAVVSCIQGSTAYIARLGNIDTTGSNQSLSIDLFITTSDGSDARVDSSHGGFISPSDYYDTVFVFNGIQFGQYTLNVAAAIFYNDGCAIQSFSSLTSAVVQVGAAAFVPVPSCNGEPSQVAISGHVLPADSATWKYTNNNSGEFNTTGIFNLPGGNTETGDSVYCIHVEGTVTGGYNQGSVTCDTIICVTVHQPPANPVVLNCANDTTVASCQNQSQVDAEFSSWLSRFNHSGGTNPVFVRTPSSPSSPPVCGGTVTIIDSLTSDCQSPVTCTAHFTVASAPDLVFICANDTTIAGGQTQATVDALFQAWLLIAQASGSCGGTLTNDGGTTGPDSCGESKTVTFSYPVCGGGFQTCSATFKTDVCTSPYVGCTLGFWKNHVSIWTDPNSAIPSCIAGAVTALGPPYSGDGTQSASFASTFGLTSTEMTNAGLSPTLTLVQALRTGGGGFKDLARQGVAALLNGCSISFPYNSSQVIVIMHNAYVSGNSNPINPSFDDLNQQQPDDCPAGGRATKRLLDILAEDDNAAIVTSPNPFSSTTNIEFEVNNTSDRTIVEIYNVAGQKIATLFDSQVELGVTYTLQFNGDGYPQGVYYAKITNDGGSNIDKLVLIK